MFALFFFNSGHIGPSIPRILGEFLALGSARTLRGAVRVSFALFGLIPRLMAHLPPYLIQDSLGSLVAQNPDTVGIDYHA